MMKKVISLSIFLISVSFYGQIPDELKPPSWKTTARLSTNIKPYILPTIDLVKLKSEDKINDSNKSKPWRFGKDQFVNHDISEVGVWGNSNKR